MKFSSVSLKGNILTFDTLEAIADGEAKKSSFRDYDYRYRSRNDLQTAITDAWADSNGQYALFQSKLGRLGEEDSGTSETRKSWIEPLLLSLGYTLTYNRRSLEIDERRYAISHAEDSLGNFPVHIVGANQFLDKRADGMRMSPHAMVQEYLNREDAQLYALVTNGKFLRLLRDSSQLTRLSYVEFDLTRIFEEELVSDFALLFRLLHRSRLPQEEDSGQDSILETYHQQGLASGSRIRSGLSAAVERGILHLGCGLLADSANASLRQWVHATAGAEERYYDHLLKLIYRLLFLMVIEERNLIFAGGAAGETLSEATARHRSIYYQHYSLSRLRRLSLQPRLANRRAYDLWENLLNTFRLFEPHGIGQRLGIEPLAGDLFRAEALGPLKHCRINNAVLLGTLNGLSEFDNEQGRKITVNYASLDVEEFGSVYEGLLEYRPVIKQNPWAFDFVKGDDRSSSGSHYTPDELVQPLIKHSLDHLIADRTVASDAPEAERREAIRKLLALTVCDVACGSGHILLAAARRIGLEVARLRSTEEQPNPGAVRRGTRDAIRHCIYGVDKNPLAVELCKVALWLEAHVPGEPLNFLDHRIKNGDAIVGLGRMEDLERGIPTEAFQATGADDDKELVKAVRKRNRDERKQREAGGGTLNLFAGTDTVKTYLDNYRERFAAFAALPERTVEEIEAKQQAYAKLIGGNTWWFVKSVADLQLAQFFLPKREEDRLTTDETYFEIMAGRQSIQSPAVAAATGVATEQRFFHWFLEFPEVMAAGGFDCVLGNPPFLGGQKISGEFGRDYAQLIKWAYEPIGSVDLVTYFFRRIFGLLAKGGFQSLVSTNTIAQGDARAGGLAVIERRGGTINHAVRSMRWPGVAAVEVALVTIFRGEWTSGFVLDTDSVEQINSYLDDQEYIGEPYKLKQNEGKSFQGSIVLGKGFVLEPEQAAALIAKDPKNKEVLFPYLNGSDLNSRPDQSPSRWVINFFDWPERRLSEQEWKELEAGERSRIEERIVAGKVVEVAPPGYGGRVAMDYLDCYGIIEREVKPERQRWKTDKDGNEIEGTYALRKPLPQRWWHYGEKRPALYETIDGMDQVVSVALTSKTVAFSFSQSELVWSHAAGVVSFEHYAYFAQLQSSFHFHWSYKYGSSMKGDLRYTSSSIFEPFPLLLGLPLTSDLEDIGRRYHVSRLKTCETLTIGLTKLYNQFHNPTLTTNYDTYFDEDGTLTVKPAELKKASKETYNLYRHLEKTEGTIPLGEAVERIAELRALHKQLDEAVLAAYGWHVDTRRWGPAIKLGHDFHEVEYLPEKDNIRYTISRKARREVLRRLLLLNHEIHEAEERGVPYEVIDGEKITALMREQVEAWCLRTERLHPRTLKFLCTGEDLLPNLERSLTKSYKPFVTQYASALENELLEKVFVAFNAAFQRRYPLEDDARATYLDAQAAINPQKLGNFTRKLKKEDTKYTLGEMIYILSLVYKPTGKTLGASTLLQDFRSFVASVYGELLFDRTLLDRLKDFTRTYRNEAAHTGEIDKTLAEGCRDEVRGVISLLVEAQR